MPTRIQKTEGVPARVTVSFGGEVEANLLADESSGIIALRFLVGLAEPVREVHGAMDKNDKG